ncbi:hypothetical protein GCM10027569_60830 [Flindersiella endophytica]
MAGRRNRRSGGRKSSDHVSGRANARDPADPADEAGPDADPEQVARSIVLKQLALQPRTKMELARTLSRRGVPDEVAGHVLGRFSEVGLIDDAAFAAAWVESRHAGRGLARRALAHELRRRGVDDRDVDAAVEQLSPDTERETARALVARKLASTRKLEPQVRLRRLAGMLARKGYPSTVALTVVREALAAEGTDAQLDGYLDAFDTEDPDDLP